MNADGQGRTGSPVARIIELGFDAYRREFRAITRRAPERFERRDWHGAQADGQRRLDLYDLSVRDVLDEVRTIAGERLHDKAFWREAIRAYSRQIETRPDRELAETFYNSITRKLFAAESVDPDVEYLTLAQTVGLREADPSIYHRFPLHGSLADCVDAALLAAGFSMRWEDRPRDVNLVVEQVERFRAGNPEPRPVEAFEVLRPVFFRYKSAFLIGRLRAGPFTDPLVLALVSTERGIAVDAALMGRDDVSILFSFARAYFLVDAESPRQLIHFLRSLMPGKPVPELYSSLGSNKHGKTELYRDLQRHLSRGEDRFTIAPGDAGMVMHVFTLDHFDIVLKVIRDIIPHPKETTRRRVMDRYRFVFRHDRVGRLVDAQEFEQLRFPRELFDDALLRELLEQAGRTVSLDGGDVVLAHVYTERRITPLNLYLRSASDDDARRAAVDYGYAIKELAAANIFPGDFLLKNFGVTRHGRVIFYDYDELCLVTDCRFRRMPQARHDEDEWSAEPWFTVAPEDVFPEEFRKFLGLHGAIEEAFLDRHGDIFTVEFWRELQARHEAGETPDFLPYRASRRLGAAAGIAPPWSDRTA